MLAASQLPMNGTHACVWITAPTVLGVPDTGRPRLQPGPVALNKLVQPPCLESGGGTLLNGHGD
jgi:hypothetical protein